MAAPQPNDRSLLDRLNALKPTSVTLDGPTHTAASTALEAQPVSKEDALTARLRILRSQSSSSSGGGVDSPSAGGAANDGPGPPAQPSAEPPVTGGNASEKKVIARAISPKTGQKPGQYQFLEADADDEDALDELLESLGDEQFDLAADADLDLPPSLDPGGDAQKLAGALRSPRKDHVPPEDDDDSDGEHMSRAVESILSQLTDEINALPPPEAAPETHKAQSKQQPQPDKPDAEAEINPNSTPPKNDHDNPLTLPTVPSQLVDPAEEPEEEEPAFEKDISARLASLRGLGSTVTTTDAFGLPCAPTFRPQDRSSLPSVPGGIKGPLGGSKYTDEDQATWCVVCLEDATIRCVGCENEGYCARCWREMHVGPAAGYDERGHQWVKFERGGRG